MENRPAERDGDFSSDRPAVVETKNLSKGFGDQVIVNRVNLNIPTGSIFGFIGPSGCGKTTTVRLLTGYYQPTEGEVRVFGSAPANFSRAEREKIGYMAQNFVLYKDLSIWENINFVASIYGLGLRRNKRLNHLLDFVELKEHKRKSVRDISGGMIRRLSLAATLVHDPKLLFLDEPTGGIDPIMRKKFWDYFETLKEQGKTLFVTTQYISEAAYCDMVGVMNEGKLIAVDTPNNLRKRALGGNSIDIKTVERLDYQHMRDLESMPFVIKTIRHGEENEIRIIVDQVGEALPQVVNWCREKNIAIESVQEYLMPLDSVFVTLIEKHKDNEKPS